MASVFDVVKNISPGKQTWRLKVRVERVWEMFPLDEPAKPFFVEMVLMDSKGDKIQASIRKPMMKKFKGVIMEGEVYKMYFFGDVRNMGSFRATRHEYKLLFHSRTKASRCDAANIPFIGLDPFSSKQIRETGGESDFLLDFVGVLTAVSDEKRSVRDGRTTRAVQMELIDEKGKAYCTLFGNYVDVVKDFASSIGCELPVVIIQYAKVKRFRGVVSLQNVLNTTRILWNPDIAPAMEFRRRLKVEAYDAEDTAAFVMFDADAEVLTGTPCDQLVSAYKDGGSDEMPLELVNLGGKEVLFRVEKAYDYAFKYDDTFRVKNICVDEEIMEHFRELRKISTPNAKKFRIPFPSLDDITEDGANHSIPLNLKVATESGDNKAFNVGDYLSEQAGCPIAASSSDVDASNVSTGDGSKGKSHCHS
ncbi:Nucleic acid-binding, OB-fold [Sesbania bispinosa]|nr:Nucleic acid-binding, OB-fold [Sesbania bispinosa]